ncbi:lanthionine synthetase LanC family protein [Hyunsoonleella pacifica]|uniref:Protein kinase domain-containing protein n=1 Tax=Hyunsoonleella pacifica TaxID=1080224 RepID=A0A4V2JB89_9FLAO|nr:lanthionine synthetase LanC family protein [Hyunsoonleella pacifica]TBN17788.1 hypothetical protein EYD46_05610 [Hyunsoonleella pacifica]GGD08952.1 hypothetical protein GCM10011368_08610 [Hyunsoonleella pacifica]
METYKNILEKHHIDFEEKQPWLICGKTNLVQGWKLHVSTTPNKIHQLFTIICPYLKQNKIAFKIIANKQLCIQLNDGDLGVTQIGKTMTIYPENETVAKQIITYIKQRTDFKFTGPKISTDIRLGSILYTRYGGYNPIIEYDRFGRKKLMIYDPYNNLIEDNYTSHLDLKYYKFPFNEFKYEIPQEERSKLLFNQYLILDVLKSHPKGQVFRGIDISNKENIKPVVIKQAVANIFCDEDSDRDIINRLNSQFQLSKKIKNINIPTPYDLKKYKENHYLITEYIDGGNLEHKVFELLSTSTFKASKLQTKKLLINYAIQLIEEVIRLHDQGIVHRDLSASNILVSKNDFIYLSDFELAYDLNNSSEHPFKGGTDGFMSLEQKENMEPKFEDDIYSVGAIITLIFTGLDPRRVLKGTLSQIKKRLLHLAGGDIEIVLDDLLNCFKPSNDRPSLAYLKSKFKQIKFKEVSNKKSSFSITKQELTTSINNCISSIAHTVYTLDDLWFSETIDKSNHEQNNKASNKTFYGSLNRGISGVLYVMAHAKISGFDITSNSKIIDKSISYLKNNYDVNINKNLLPGLHFGTAGIAVSIAYCISSGILPRNNENLDFIKKSLIRDLDWSDYTHGAAGQGMACLKVMELIGFDKDVEMFLQKCYGYLKTKQEAQGYWVIEEGVDGISGETMCGFAHGVAGIANFVLSYYKYSQNIEALVCAEKAAEWLYKNKIDKETYYEWTFSETNQEIWNWWCHGATGIAIFFLNIYDITKKEKYLNVITKSLNAVNNKPNFPNLSLCHGLSGIGEILLHAYGITNNRSYPDRINWVLGVLLNSFIKENNSMYWLTENPDYPTADFFVGNGGILYFLIDYYNMFYQNRDARFPIT